jgi:hypothetical protein
MLKYYDTNYITLKLIKFLQISKMAYKLLYLSYLKMN